MKITATLICILALLQLSAQQNIEDVRRLNEGEKVTVSGIVTNGNELGTIRYLQDNTAGLGIYDDKLAGVKRGDSITVSGKIESYNNLFEITTVSSLVVHSSGNELPKAKIITIDEIGEDFEGQIIEVKDILIENAGGLFTGNKNYNFTNNATSGIFRINSNSPIVGQVVPGDKINLIAICSQYSFDSPDEGYQLLPRTMDDFISSSPINFTSPVLVSNIRKDGFTLKWSTDVASTPGITYRLGYSEHTWTKEVLGTTTEENGEFTHTVELTDLFPSAYIIATAFSATETDTAKTSENVYVTESNSTGEILAYFNTDVNEDVASGTIAKKIHRAMEDTLIAYINRAIETIDLSIYNINNGGLNSISDALNEAAQRGVKVRVITCGSTAHLGIDDLDPAIPFLERPDVRNGGIMHNKFAIFDAQAFSTDTTDQSKSWIWSGSTNLTYDQINSDANNMIFIQDKALALAYLTEFNEMWGSTGMQANAQKAKFGAKKTDNTPHEFIIGGNRVQSYFSPSDGTNQKIIESMNTADNDLNVETVLITRSDLAFAIKDAQQRGVEVHVLNNNKSGNSETANNILTDALPEGKFIFDNIANGTMHHKMAIIDANYPASDPQVITGSHNWSNSANDRNDENTLIIHSAEIANEYFQQFAYRFNENDGELTVSADKIEMNALSVYPNPTKNVLSISSPVLIEKIELFSVSGVKIEETAMLDETHTTIDLSAQKAGIYILRVRFKENKFNTYKIVKK